MDASGCYSEAMYHVAPFPLVNYIQAWSMSVVQQMSPVALVG